MKKFSLLTILALLTFVFASCNSDSEPYELKTQQNFTQCFAKVTDTRVNHDSYTINSPVTVFLEVKYHSQTCNITISGLKTADGTTYPALTFEDMKWTADDKGWGMCENMIPTVSSKTPNIALPEISNFKFKWNNREALSNTLGTSGLSVCEFSMTIDGIYQVTGSRSEIIISGDTVSSPEGGLLFKSTAPLYSIVLKFDTMKADIRISNAMFYDSMKPLQLDLLGVPFTFKDFSQVIELKAEAIVPSINGVPQTEMPITEFNGALTAADGGRLTFKTSIDNKLYDVTANLTILAVPTIIEK